MSNKKPFDSWDKRLENFLVKQKRYYDSLLLNPQFLEEHRYIRSLEEEQYGAATDSFCRRWKLKFFPYHLNEKIKRISGRQIGFVDKGNGKRYSFYDQHGKTIHENRKLFYDNWKTGIYIPTIENWEEEYIANDLIPFSPDISFELIDRNKGVEKGNVRAVKLTISSIDNYSRDSLLYAYHELKKWQKAFVLSPFDESKRRATNNRYDYRLIRDKHTNPVDCVWIISSITPFISQDIKKGYAEYNRFKRKYGLLKWQKKRKEGRDAIFFDLYKIVVTKHPKHRQLRKIRETANLFISMYPKEINGIILEHIRRNTKELVEYARSVKKGYVIPLDQVERFCRKIGDDNWDEVYGYSKNIVLYDRSVAGYTHLENIIRNAIRRK